MNNLYNWNVNKYSKHTNFELAQPIIKLLNPQENEKILDLGCGDGTLAIEIEKSNAKVIAVDLSQDMVKRTKERGIESYLMNATELKFENEFNAVFSNLALHWVKDSKMVIKKVHTALKDNGRFIAEFGGYGDIKRPLYAMQKVFENNKEYGKFNKPWYFPKETDYKQLLESNGFKVEYIELISRPTKIVDITNWLDMFTNGIIFHLTNEQQINFKKEVREILKPMIYSEKNGWVVNHVRLRFKAIKV